MADYMAANIKIGGPVTPELVERLAAAAESQGVTIVGDPDSNESLVERILFWIDPGHTSVVFEDDEARYGEFEDLEKFCRDNGLSYVRHNDGKYELNAEFAWWKPGMPAPATCESNNNEDVLLRADAIRDILNGPGGCIKRLDEIREYLEQNTPPDVPPLVLTGTAAPVGT